MKITIITACRNAEGTIRDALESVRRQKIGAGVELEHVVVDGGSTDGTVGVIKGFDRRNSTSIASSAAFSFRWLSEQDNGLYDAMNKGIRLATGDVIGILNADDVFDGDGVLAQVAAAFGGAKGNALDAVYGSVRFVKKLGGTTVRRYFARPWRPWMLQWGYMPPHPGLFIRRDCFTKWGGYVGDRREYGIAADCELLVRFFRIHGMRARHLGFCTTVMRLGGLSTRGVGARIALNREIIKANRANGYFCCWPMLLPKYAVKIWEVILPRALPSLR